MMFGIGAHMPADKPVVLDAEERKALARELAIKAYNELGDVVAAHVSPEKLHAGLTEAARLTARAAELTRAG